MPAVRVFSFSFPTSRWQAPDSRGNMTVLQLDVQKTLRAIPLDDIQQLIVITVDSEGEVKAYTTEDDPLITAEILWDAYEKYEPDDGTDIEFTPE